jgi:epoxyqueuosine reductase
MQDTLVRQLEARGYRARVVSAQRFDDLREAVASLFQRDLFDSEFHQECLARVIYGPPEDLPEARSLIVLALPDRPVRFCFGWRGARVPFAVPPTYLHWREKDRWAQDALAGLLAPEGWRAARAVAPNKLLAVCSGLAAYGRNNISYVEGLGSYHRLAAFCSDLPCEQDTWREPAAMERCEGCQRCAASCPTGAIDPQRFLLRAERCITYHNEKPSQVAFPQWLQPSSHNCLVGCLRCQRACPENRGVLGWVEEGAEFSEEETGLLLAGVPLAGLPAALAGKLARWDLLDLLDVLPRNLGALLEQADRPPA